MLVKCPSCNIPLVEHGKPPTITKVFVHDRIYYVCSDCRVLLSIAEKDPFEEGA